MPTLHQYLSAKVDSWREAGFPCEEFPAVAEILRFQTLDSGAPRFLRLPQLRALETYWFLRLIEKTPRVFDMYQAAFNANKREIREVLGVPRDAYDEVDEEMDALWERIRDDEAFAAKYKLDVLRESMTLSYPSYIFALAMGAGKTILIGAIIATEFALASEYRDREDAPFICNALVFAPGKTILGALRQITHIPFDRILPARFYSGFQPQVKFTFTRDGEKDIPVVRGSIFNVVITNIEKIRIRKESISITGQGRLPLIEKEKQKEELANLRLQTLASLPHLAIFSDEAHHTYGADIGKDLKKVRLTVDYLADKTNLICTVNTTGTPYAGKEMLKDVVYWYGLSEGIADGYLKSVKGNIESYSFKADNAAAFLAQAVSDFFGKYLDVKLPDGTPAKLAIYFPKTEDIRALRDGLEVRLAELGVDASLILEHTTAHNEEAEFNDFRHSAKRVALLVDRGVEGWDVPALFGCILARKLKSNNFVLQAATRCLRQVPGNPYSAWIGLSADNYKMLDDALKESFGLSLAEAKKADSQSRQYTLRVRKLDLPPLCVQQTIRTVHRVEKAGATLKLSRPNIQATETLTRESLSLAQNHGTARILKQLGDTLTLEIENTIETRTAAVRLAALYRLELWPLLDQLCALYPEAEIPLPHLSALAQQIEAHVSHYEIREQQREVALALVRYGAGTAFSPHTENGETTYTATISVPLNKQHLVKHHEDLQGMAGEFGFHYSPYNFDSNPESDYFERVLELANEKPENVEDILFTGALTDPKESDFWVWYRKDDDSWARYTPDFLIRLKDGRALIVEVKTPQAQAGYEEDEKRFARGESPVTGEFRKALALREWEHLAPDKIKYQIVFSTGEVVPGNALSDAREFIS